MKPKERQLEFRPFDWGGKRRGAGRKPKGERAGVSHARRPERNPRHPLLVTLRALDEAGELREDAVLALLRRCIERSNARGEFQIVEFSLQSNHVHLIVEVDSQAELSRAMNGFASSLARGINRLKGRTGHVFGDRYHAQAYDTPTAVRYLLVYVLANAFKHRAWRRAAPDPFSSGPQFDGWREHEVAESRWLPRARTWLLAVGWRRLGLLSVRERPKSRIR